MQHFCRTAAVSLLNPIVPQPPQPWPPLRCPSLHALVTELVVKQVDLRHGVVDTERVGEGLQSWHDAHGQVDSRPVGVSLQLCCYALSTGSSACLAQTCTRDMPRLALVPSHVRSSCHYPAHSLLTIFVW